MIHLKWIRVDDEKSLGATIVQSTGSIKSNFSNMYAINAEHQNLLVVDVEEGSIDVEYVE